MYNVCAMTLSLNVGNLERELREVWWFVWVLGYRAGNGMGLVIDIGNEHYEWNAHWVMAIHLWLLTEGARTWYAGKVK